ncbi:MAG: hypothetical protein U0Q18_11270 [Bryobacteraceae bacterium]
MNRSRLQWVGVGGVLVLGTMLAPVWGGKTTASYVFTATARWDPDAWIKGGERFPAGAAIRIAGPTETRDAAPGFFTTADPDVSFDAQRILFAGRQRRQDPWQIWEIPAAGGPPRRVTNSTEDSGRPLYLPGNKCVYARKAAAGFQLEVIAVDGGEPLQITFAPGGALTCDVLHDGRVLFETATHELFTVYPDGSGVESYRCDHGPARHAGRQVASGDVVFATTSGLARFTSALAVQVDGTRPPSGDYVGPVAETAVDQWLVAFRPDKKTPYSIYAVNPAGGSPSKVSSVPGVQPIALVPRETPRRFPSGLHDWAGANVLCLNAYMSKTQITEGAIGSVRLYSQGANGSAVTLGETAVESDGSFFLHVPSEKPLRLELRDRSGRVIESERNWFWMKRGEQRVCVGCHAGPERTPDNAVPKVLVRTTVPVSMTGGGSQ